MTTFLTNVLGFVLPYAVVFGLGFVFGFMSRNTGIDHLKAEIVQLKKALAGEEIRTSRTPEPVRPVQPRTPSARTEQPMYGPAHSAARTEPLPAGVRYVLAAEGDEPISDAEYALRYSNADD